MSTQRKLLALFSAACILFTQTAAANCIQWFNNATFQNPARMNTTKDTYLLTGAMYTNIYGRYSGTCLGDEGTVKSNNTLLFPYIVWSHRISDRFVGGMDISTPVIGYISWPDNAFTQNLGVDANLLSFDIAPKLSIKISDNWAFGASMRYFSLWRTELNFSYLNAFERNRANGSGYGGSVGLWYMFNYSNFFDLSYFTPIKVTLNRQASSTGPSPTVAGQSVTRRDFYFKPFTYSPGTIVFNWTHIFNQTFLIASKVAYSFWSVDQQLILQNTAIGYNPTIFNLKWKDSWMCAFFGRAQTTQKTAFMMVVGYDQSLVNSGNNVIAFPIGDLFFAGIGGEYRYNDKSILQLMVSQGRTWRPKIHTDFLGARVADGVALPRYTIVDLSTTMDF